MPAESRHPRNPRQNPAATADTLLYVRKRNEATCDRVIYCPNVGVGHFSCRCIRSNGTAGLLGYFEEQAPFNTSCNPRRFHCSLIHFMLPNGLFRWIKSAQP